MASHPAVSLSDSLFEWISGKVGPRMGVFDLRGVSVCSSWLWALRLCEFHLPDRLVEGHERLAYSGHEEEVFGAGVCWVSSR